MPLLLVFVIKNTIEIIYCKVLAFGNFCILIIISLKIHNYIPIEKTEVHQLQADFFRSSVH
ncbi:hypothetical protein HMPREF0322_01836 [Desulfitobacterium hafniense DP7]|uniref:Uncharacterized protein n=1 Tax=Desulfitobacterium hafniense DP7 TaxID=537010 RepID=G9XLK1_DESHA|nr:hypothetical protein HMPREF0322_01836 [Desulfitobacterium hafniense DP7]